MDNEFPYAFSPDVIHKVIWSADELTIEEYRLCLNKHFSDADYDIVMFINPIHQKSVAGVHHGHALMRKKQAAITNLIAQDGHGPHQAKDRQRSVWNRPGLKLFNSWSINRKFAMMAKHSCFEYCRFCHLTISGCLIIFPTPSHNCFICLPLGWP